jgi:putative spermidine/putrescine transport system permease protein
LVLLWMSFTAPTAPTPTLSQYGAFFGDAINVAVLRDTLVLGLQVTALCLLLGFPVAYVYNRTPPVVQRIVMILIVLPLLTSAVVRSFAFIVILGRSGIVNSMLLALHIVDRPIPLLFKPLGVIVALAQVELPLMVLPLISAMARIDVNLESASASLGASAWRTFWQVTVPLALPGIIGGSLLVFVLAVSGFITPSIIGGGRLLYMPILIYQQGITLLNWPQAAAVSMLLLATSIVVVVVMNAMGSLTRRYVSHT